MNHPENYLAKFKVAGSEVKEAALEVIFKQAGVKLEKSQLRLSGFNLHLTVRPVERSVIFIKKEKILAELRQLLDKQAPKNIL